MLIALDYDKTYTADPSFWDAFIVSALKASHKVVCLTMRVTVPDMPCPVFCTAGKNKWDEAKRHGLSVDIWIDDSPRSILHDAGDYQ